MHMDKVNFVPTMVPLHDPNPCQQCSQAVYRSVWCCCCCIMLKAVLQAKRFGEWSSVYCDSGEGARQAGGDESGAGSGKHASRARSHSIPLKLARNGFLGKRGVNQSCLNFVRHQFQASCSAFGGPGLGAKLEGGCGPGSRLKVPPSPELQRKLMRPDHEGRHS